MTDRSTWASTFGLDAAGYDHGRPDYPERVYELLRARCDLGPGTRAFEIGPGTGIATRALLASGVAALTAIEPDPRLAAFLAASPAGADQRLRIVKATFADAALPEASFDLGVAATTMHWLDPGPAMSKIARLLRPGGSWAMWWTIFGDAIGVDAFHEATLHLFPPVEPGAPSISVSQPFALDPSARFAELAAAGLVPSTHELIRWSAPFDVKRTKALYSTFPHIRTMPSAERVALLDAIGRVVTDAFGGLVERTMLTPVYIAYRP
jgi:SAM-dependent methyltransferase